MNSLKFLTVLGVVALAAVGGFFFARWNVPGSQSPMTSAVAPAEPVAAPAGRPGELTLDASYLATVGIETAAVKAGNLSADVVAPATVTATASGEGAVTAHVAGTIVQLLKQAGDPVRAGETLAFVESRDAVVLAADLKVAQSKADLARSSLAREQALFDQRVTPRQDLERVQAELAVAEAELQRAREVAAAAHVAEGGRIAVLSPLAGRITALGAALGTFVQPETELFRIRDPRFVQIEASVTAVDAQRIAIGDPAKIVTATSGALRASVRAISPIVNEQTRAATVMLTLATGAQDLSAGQLVQATITPRSSAASGIVIPEDAVQNVGGRSVVFVRTAGGFKVQPVVIGGRRNKQVSILSGVNEGETIATTNAFFLKAELEKGGEEE